MTRNNISKKSKGKGLSLPKDKILTKPELLGELTRLRKKLVKFENLGLIADSKTSVERKQAAEEASRMVTVVRDSNDAITIQDLKGKITAWNRGAEKMYGYSEQEALQMNLRHLTPPDKEAEQKDFNRRIFAGENVTSFETQRLTKAGRLVDVWMVVTKLVDAAGKVIGIASTERDITEKESEERSRIIAESITDVIYEWDLKESITWFGDVDGLLGYPAGVFPRTLDGWAAALHPEDKDRVWMAVEKQLKGAVPYDVEYRIQGKDGAWRWWSARGTVIKNERDEPGRWIGAVTDVTERKQAEEKLSSSEAFLNSVIEQSTESLWVSDSEGTMMRMNPACRELFGITDEEVVGKYNLFKDNLIEEQGFMPLVEAVFRKGGIARFTTDYDLPKVEHIKVSGAMHRIIDVVISPIKDLSGKVTNAIIQHRDITERKQAEVRLQKTMEDLARSNAELEQFAYVASHDLQEPLRMVASYMQLIEKRYKSKLDADADEFIGYAVDGAVRMKAMINDLLNFSRLATRGKDPEPVDCQAVLSTAMTNLGVAIEESQAEISNDSLPMVKGDETQLVRLFQNLLDNAIKFRGADIPRVQISCQAQNGSYLFSIRDNGIGIDPQYFDRIFIVFQRLREKENYPGTGIGLAMCKKIVERHHGKIWIDSEPGKGTTFYFTLPGV
jgi:PAS domain S-box-containing protein